MLTLHPPVKSPEVQTQRQWHMSPIPLSYVPDVCKGRINMTALLLFTDVHANK